MDAALAATAELLTRQPTTGTSRSSGEEIGCVSVSERVEPIREVSFVLPEGVEVATIR